MSDLHEAVFRWPRSEPTTVILTGSFDEWSSSINLRKGPDGFEGTVCVPWGARIPYKFIVDGRWMTQENKPTEYDSLGNLNNVYVSPPQPSTHIDIPSPIPKPAASRLSAVPNTNGSAADLAPSKSNDRLGSVTPPAETVPAVHDSPVHLSTESEPSKALDTEKSANQSQAEATSEPESATSDTIRNRTESPLDHATSSVGAAVDGFISADSRSNPGSLETPLPDAVSQELDVDSNGGDTMEASPQVASEVATTPENDAADSVTAEAEVASTRDVEILPVAPDVPVPILPVNDVDTITTPSNPAAILDKELPTPPAAESLGDVLTASETEKPSTHAAIVPALSESGAPVVGGFSTDANVASPPSPPAEIESDTRPTQSATPTNTTSEPQAHTEPASFVEADENLSSSTSVAVPTPTAEPSTSPEVVGTTSSPHLTTTVETAEETIPVTGSSTPPALALATIPETTQDGASTPTPKPALNGNGVHRSPPPSLEKSESSSPPTTPKKPMRFPSSSSASTSPTASPSSSRFGTPSSRKKRHSILGKIKDIFTHHHKDKEGKELAK